MKRIVIAALGFVALAVPAFAADRFPQIPLDKMTPAQRKSAEAIMAGPRKSLQGPFNTWLRSPDLADRLQAVGEYIRFKSALPKALNEFAIIITAREWTSQYEWFVHAPLAVQAGLKPEIAEALRLGKRPAGMSDNEALIYDASLSLHRNKGHLSDALFEKALKAFGEQGVVDLIGVNGYYSAVSMTLNAAQVELPDGSMPLGPVK